MRFPGSRLMLFGHLHHPVPDAYMGLDHSGQEPIQPIHEPVSEQTGHAYGGCCGKQPRHERSLEPHKERIKIIWVREQGKESEKRRQRS